MHKSAVYFLPVVNSLAVHYLHGYLLETLLIARLRNLGYDLLIVYVLLQSERLIGIELLVTLEDGTKERTLKLLQRGLLLIV